MRERVGSILRSKFLAESLKSERRNKSKMKTEASKRNRKKMSKKKKCPIFSHLEFCLSIIMLGKEFL